MHGQKKHQNMFICCCVLAVVLFKNYVLLEEASTLALNDIQNKVY